jgi:cytochrome c biogenesis protein CcmG, thiol:disulfide interchange protein DsbE
MVVAMKVIRFPLSIIFLASLLVTACSHKEVAMLKGQPTPSFSLKNLQQQVINFPDDFNNKVVLISFWADWCPSCKKELRDFEVIYKKYQGQGVAVLALNIDQDKQTAMAFIADLNLSYEVLLDNKGDVAKHYATTSLPSALIVDRDGNLHTRLLGETPAEVFEKIITSLL